jgi:hypothetical protein
MFGAAFPIKGFGDYRSNIWVRSIFEVLGRVSVGRGFSAAICNRNNRNKNNGVSELAGIYRRSITMLAKNVIMIVIMAIVVLVGVLVALPEMLEKKKDK